MIRIQTRRAGLLALAAVTFDDGAVTMTFGLTAESATRRLIRLLDREVAA